MHTAAGGSDITYQARVNNKCKHSFSAKAPQCPNLDITRHGVHNTITSKCRIKPDIPSAQEQAAGKKAASCRRPSPLCMYIFQTVSIDVVNRDLQVGTIVAEMPADVVVKLWEDEITPRLADLIHSQNSWDNFGGVSAIGA